MYQAVTAAEVTWSSADTGGEAEANALLSVSRHCIQFTRI